MQRFFASACLVLIASSALAADAVCPEINALQRWAGYLSWMGFLKLCSVLALAVGACIFFWGFITWAIENLWNLIRGIVDVVGYAASAALVIGGASVSPEYQLWLVLGGCILFGASVQATVWLRELKGDSPTPIFALYAVVWGAVAVYYNMPEVGFLAVAAVMGLIGFSVWVSPFCYAFGFRKDEDIAAGTAAALMLLIAYCLGKVFAPEAAPALKVFEPGVFWLGSLVGYIGLLILSNKWYQGRNGFYGPMQVVACLFYFAGIAIGMIFGINALAGIAGTMLVFYAAAKLIEIEADTAMGWGFKIMLVGGVFSGAWYWANRHEALVKTYLTITLPS
jgi:hypothetical protein